MTNRYLWQSKLTPVRQELFDRVTASVVAIVVFDGESQRWEWTRFTSSYLHGAPPNGGSTGAGWQSAMREALDGLPDSVTREPTNVALPAGA